MATKGTKIGAQRAANMLGIHVDTLRKRIKAGKIKALFVKGKWALELADVEAYGKGASTVTAAPKIPGIPTTQPKNCTDVVFVLDRSGSMMGLYGSAKENLDRYVAELLKASDAGNEYTVSLVNFDDNIEVTLRHASLTGLRASNHYKTPAGMTRLWDAIDAATKLCDEREDGHRAFLIYVLTDGGENSSHGISETILRAKILGRTQTDRYTFAVAGPKGIGASMFRIGIPAGNVTEWEQTVAGSTYLGNVTTQSIGTYAATRSTGITSSNSFYANVSVPAAQFAAKLGDQLDDVTGQVRVERVTDKDPDVIKKFCLTKFGSFPKGTIYYQLTKTAGEKVQDYKKIIVQDGTTGRFYQGWDAARRLLGIPSFKGTVKIKPGTLGEFKVFVQSTSENRRLHPGTAVVRFP